MKKVVNEQQEARENADRYLIRKDYRKVADQALQEISSQLKELRELAELSQQESAYYIGLDRSVISKIERGKYLSLSIKDLIVLCQLYGYEPCDLFHQILE